MALTKVPTHMLDRQMFIVKDSKTDGTDGGGFTSGSWVTRDLNTIEVNDIGVVLDTKQLTFPAGAYYVSGWATGFKCDQHKAGLYDTTGEAFVVQGSVARSDAAVGQTSLSVVEGYFELTEESVLELQHQCSTTRATDGLGKAVGFGPEVYSKLCFWKVG